LILFVLLRNNFLFLYNYHHHQRCHYYLLISYISFRFEVFLKIKIKRMRGKYLIQKAKIIIIKYAAEKKRKILLHLIWCVCRKTNNFKQNWKRKKKKNENNNKMKLHFIINTTKKNPLIIFFRQKKNKIIKYFFFFFLRCWQNQYIYIFHSAKLTFFFVFK